MQRVETHMDVSPSSTGLAHEERSMYEQQIAVLREDFLRERSDRERAVGRVDTLERILENVKRDYNQLQCKIAALENVHRAKSTPYAPFGSPYTYTYQSDCISDDEDVAHVKEKMEGDSSMH